MVLLGGGFWWEVGSGVSLLEQGVNDLPESFRSTTNDTKLVFGSLFFSLFFSILNRTFWDRLGWFSRLVG